jgi:hypothetical protein
MPIKFLHSGDEQALALLIILFCGFCARHWRTVLAIVAVLLIGITLIVLNVILDLRIMHEITAYLHNLA